MRSFASALLLLVVTTTPLYGDEDEVVRAIEKAAKARVGSAAVVSVGEVSGLRLLAARSALTATPDPSGRIGAPVRFVLADATPGRVGARVGEATATVQVSIDAVRARRAIARGTALGEADVTVSTTDLAGRPFRPVLPLESTLGSRAVHDIAADALVTHGDVMPAPLVKAGDIVRATIRVGEIEIANDVVAAESGLRDEVIRVVNQDSRHTFRAKVTGRGEVEVVNVR